MATITFTIPNEKLLRITDALAGLYPIPQVNNGTEEEPDMQPEFTNNQWAKESVRRWIVRQTARWEQKVAKEAIVFSPEDDIIT